MAEGAVERAELAPVTPLLKVRMATMATMAASAVPAALAMELVAAEVVLLAEAEALGPLA
jgi:hypothetical protein